MSTSRPFAYNTGSLIQGTLQIGNLAIGTPTDGFASTGLDWWNGPNEDLGYVITIPVSDNSQPTPILDVYASVGFYGTEITGDPFSDFEFINLTNNVFSLNLTTAFECSEWLTNNGYWNSYLYYFNSTNTLTWPTSTDGYNLYEGEFIENGYSNPPISLPVEFSMDGSYSYNIYLSKNGYFTLGSGNSAIINSPQELPGSVAGNPVDGTIQNLYFQTNTDGNKYNVKLLVDCKYESKDFGLVNGSYILNFYRDNAYQWVETRVEIPYDGVNYVGPYSSGESVVQESKTTSQVWRGNLSGSDWVYMGDGTVV